MLKKSRLENNAGSAQVELTTSGDLKKAKKMFGNQSSYVQIVVGDVAEPINIAEKVDYIIHGASMTSSKEFVDYPVETILTGMTGTDNVLRFAKEKEVKSMVYLSSLEVYGVTDPNKKSVKEDEYGYIDQMLPRSSYSEGKRMAEVKLKEGETLDSALRRFKRQVARTGVLAELRKREHYEKPSVKRKKKSEAARKRKYK